MPEGVRESYDELLRMTSLLADAIIQRMDPVKDELSQREAVRIYGDRFVRRAVSDGCVCPKSVANRKVYSRRELNAYRYASELSRMTVRSKILQAGADPDSLAVEI